MGNMVVKSRTSTYVKAIHEPLRNAKALMHMILNVNEDGESSMLGSSIGIMPSTCRSVSLQSGHCEYLGSDGEK